MSKPAAPAATYPVNIRIKPRWKRILNSPFVAFHLWRLPSPRLSYWLCLKTAFEVAAARYGDEKR